MESNTYKIAYILKHIQELRILLDKKVNRDNPIESFRLYNELLLKLSTPNITSDINAESVYALQQNSDVLTICSEFYHKYKFSYSVIKTIPYLFNNNSSYEDDIVLVEKFSEALDFLKLYNYLAYCKWAPVLIYYLGGSFEAYKLLDDLDTEDEKSVMDARLEYYFYRSALDCYSRGKGREIESIKAAAIKQIGGCDLDETNTYYYNLIKSFNVDLFYKRKIEIVNNNASKELLFSNIEKGLLNEDALIRFLVNSESILFQTENLIRLTRIWDFFDITKEERKAIRLLTISKNSDKLTQELRNGHKLEYLSELIQSSFPRFLDEKLFKEWHSCNDIEEKLVGMVCENANNNKPQDFLLLFCYFYAKNNNLSTLSLFCLFHYSLLVQEMISSRHGKLINTLELAYLVFPLSGMIIAADSPIKILLSVALSIGVYVGKMRIKKGKNTNSQLLNYDTYQSIKREFLQSISDKEERFGINGFLFTKEHELIKTIINGQRI